MIAYIVKFLQNNDSVYVNDLGTFSKQYVPAHFEGSTLMPPRFNIVLDTTVGMEEMGLTNFVCQENQWLITKASMEIDRWVDELKNALANNKSISYDNFGTFELNSKGAISFQCFDIAELNKEFEGMNAISTDGTAPVVAEDSTEEPVSEPTEEPAPEPVVEPVPEPAPEPEEEEELKPIWIPEPAEEPAPEPVAEPVPEPAPEPEEEEELKPIWIPEPAEEPAPEPVVEPVPEPAPEPEEEEELKPIWIPEPAEEPAPEPVAEPVPEPAPEPEEEEKPEPEQETDEKTGGKKKRHWWWVILLIILAALAAAGYFFRNDLMSAYQTVKDKFFQKKEAVEQVDESEATEEIAITEPEEPEVEEPEVYEPEVISNTVDGKYRYINFESGHYYAIAGSFPSEKDIETHIRQRGLDKYDIYLVKQAGLPNIRVCIGIFDTEEEATTYAKDINPHYWVLK